MTREEILALSDDELQLEVARLKGWRVTGPHRLTPDSEPYFRIVSPEGRTGIPRHFATARETLLYETLQYSREIDKAWPLIDEIGPTSFWRRRVSHEQVRLRLFWLGGTEEPEFSLEASGKSDAEAICRAYLIAVEGDEQQ
jgi:hypothetical protein